MTGAISQRASAYFAAWHSRRPTLALMGEFSSGKSALLNCLIGRTLLPTRATATDMPAIWLSHGQTERVRGLGYDGQLAELSLADLTEGRAQPYLCIRIELSAEVLQSVDIIDTPGISDPRMTTEIVEEVARNVDFVVWCSPMTQAWRQTERAFWRALPDRIRPRSILALTRADLIANPKDIEKVIRRCRAESDDGFKAILPVATPLVELAKAAATVGERSQLLQASGLPAFADQLEDSIALAAQNCNARAIFAEPEALKTLPLTAEMWEDAPNGRAQKKVASAKAPAKVSRKQNGMPSALLEAVNNFSPNEQGLDTIRHLLTQVSKEKALTVEHRDVLIRALTVEVVGDMQVGKILKQVRHELQDFADGAWCDLGQAASP